MQVPAEGPYGGKSVCIFRLDWGIMDANASGRRGVPREVVSRDWLGNGVRPAIVGARGETCVRQSGATASMWCW